MIKKLFKDFKKDGGFTIDKDLQTIDKQVGYMVGGYSIAITFRLKDITFKQFEKIINDYRKVIIIDDIYIGGWIDNNIIYIELSKHIEDKTGALKEAEELKQLAIFDIKNNQSIYLKN